jgi:SAM-dependent methyltransferase
MTSIDSEALRRQYATDYHLRVRQETHDRYSVPPVNFPEWVISRATWRGDEMVLDVGSGTGTYAELLKKHLPRVRYVGMDNAPGLLRIHPVRGALTLADAQRLPFPKEKFDVVLANHMLYHVPDVDLALREFRRVLKPNGLLLASTNSLQTMPEFQALFRRSLMLLSAPGKVYSQPPPLPHNPFALENGVQQLARHFYAVVRHDLPGALVFHSVEPVMAYLSSWRSIREPQLPKGIRWDDLMLVMRDQVSRVIGHFGEIVINKLTGVLIASNRGGFIHEFVETLEQSMH